MHYLFYPSIIQWHVLLSIKIFLPVGFIPIIFINIIIISIPITIIIIIVHGDEQQYKADTNKCQQNSQHQYYQTNQ